MYVRSTQYSVCTEYSTFSHPLGCDPLPQDRLVSGVSPVLAGQLGKGPAHGDRTKEKKVWRPPLQALSRATEYIDWEILKLQSMYEVLCMYPVFYAVTD